MKPIDDIGKNRVFGETEEYVDRIVSQCTEKAIARAKGHRQGLWQRPLYKAISAAAAVLLIVGIGVWLFSAGDDGNVPTTADLTAQLMQDESWQQDDKNAVDNVLLTMSDDDAQNLVCIEYVDYEDASF